MLLVACVLVAIIVSAALLYRGEKVKYSPAKSSSHPTVREVEAIRR